MARVKLHDPIRLDNGTVTTCAKLLDAGRAVVVKNEKWRNRTTPIYFCDLFSPETGKTSGGWEISKYAYESRLAQSEATKRVASKEKVDYSPLARLRRAVEEVLVNLPDGRSEWVSDWHVTRKGEMFDLGIEGEELYTFSEAMEVLAG
jgi:hypothetical protein